MAPSIDIRPPPNPWTRPRPRSPNVAGIALALVAAVAAIALNAAFLRDPRLVNVTVVNSSGFNYDVAVSNRAGQGWLFLGAAGQHCSVNVNDVVDQGDTWTFRFRAQGVPAGQVTITREELQRAGWRFQVPAQIEQQLVSASVAPPPTRRCATP